SVGKLTIGIGRNLDDVGISYDEAEVLLANDIQRTQSALTAALPWLTLLDLVRKAAVINMAFNLGVSNLLAFHKFLGFLQSHDWQSASIEMLNSKWASQVGPRATRLSRQILTGEWQ